MKRPHVIVIAGPNGAGKSTTAPSLLRGALGVREFVNADTIAAGLSAFRPEAMAWKAGRLLWERIRDLAACGADFAFETTLASRSFAPWIKSLQEQRGYAFHLVFLGLRSPELALARVADRVRLGGHDVPEEVVRRRFAAGLRNFFRLYRPLATSWFFYDNSTIEGPVLIAMGRGRQAQEVRDPELWSRIEEEYGDTECGRRPD